MPFPINCGACGATFNIPDDIYQRRVAGRVVNIRCKQCKADIQVDGTAHEPDREGAASLPPALASESPSPAAVMPTTEAQPQAQPGADTRVSTDRPFEQATPKLAVDAGIERTAFDPTSWVKETDEPSRPVQTSPIHSAGSPQGAAALAYTESAVLATPASTNQHAEPRVDKTSVKQKIAASRRAREERAERRAARKAGPSGQKATESDPTQQAATPADLWAISYGDEDDRELTEAQIAAEIRRGSVHRDTLVWRDGMEGWQPLGRIPELVKLLPREEENEGGDAEPSRPKATPVVAPLAMPPPLGRTTLGVGPVSIPEPVATPSAGEAKAVRSQDPVFPVPATSVGQTSGASPAAAAAPLAIAAPALAAPALAPPAVVASGVEPTAWAAQQAAPNPFMDNPLLISPPVQTGAALQSPPVAPPAARARPVSLDLEALPPVKKGRPVLWITAIVGVVAAAVIIGMVMSWANPPAEAIPSATSPSLSPASAPGAPSVETVGASPRQPAQPAPAGTTRDGRVDLLSPGTAASAPKGGAKPDTKNKKGSSRKTDFSAAFADKLQGKNSKR